MMNVKTICDSIDKLISKVRIPLPDVPAALIACGSITRPGVSPMLVASEIIRRESEVGAYQGALPDGTANIMEQMELIRTEEIFKAIKRDMKIDVAIPPGAISIGIPGTEYRVVNDTFVKGTGIAR